MNFLDDPDVLWFVLTAIFFPVFSYLLSSFWNNKKLSAVSALVLSGLLAVMVVVSNGG
jgi:hypothetical protein